VLRLDLHQGQTPWYACAMSVSRLLIASGIVLVAVGLLWPLISKLGLGRLPGDIVSERENFRDYLPLATSLLVSLLLSLILRLLSRFRHPRAAFSA
jgi:hypothetical protein